jgi:arylsulfatase A-like enzyme
MRAARARCPRRIWVAAALAAAALLGLPPGAGAAGEARDATPAALPPVPPVAAVGPPAPLRPSAIVLVTVDTLRADRVSFGGYRLPTTPFLDRLAGEGVTFESSYATSSWTPPTMASIFTGVPPMTHGVVSGQIVGTEAVRQPVLPDSLGTIAEHAARLGFRTLGVASNRHLSIDLGFAQGFDRYFDPPAFIGGTAVNEEARRLLRAEYGEDWKAAWHGAPLFLWLHYFDPHDPYLPYDPWIAEHAPKAIVRGEKSPARLVMAELKLRFPKPDAALAEVIRPIYDSEIRRTDELLATLWSELAPDGNVLFILTADHGEEMGERGQLGHSHSLHDELVRVPLLFWWPRGIPGGVRVRQPVSAIDILPTVLDLLGEPVPASLPGRSLAPLWRSPHGGGAAPSFPPVFLELHPPKPFRWAVVEGRWKLIVDPAKPGAAELYDLERDPGERANLAAREPATVERLRDLFRAWARRNPRAADQRTRDRLDPELRKELEALGYLGAKPPR